MGKMKFILVASFIFLSLSCTKKEENAIVIDKIKISKNEFEDAFEKSIYARTPTKENRREFLENFINRKLILREAEELGLSKDPQFLDSVHSFWEQSLLKLILDNKIKELSLGIRVDDAEIRNFYELHKDKFPNKEQSDVYDEIKFLIFKEKQKNVLEEWMDSLRKETKIKINYKLLDLE